MPELLPGGLRRKLWRDLSLHRARSLLVVLAVAIGLVGAGAILNAWALVQRATELGYRGSLPVSATLQVEALDATMQATLLPALRQLPGVAAARARRTVTAAVQSQGAWQRAVIFALDDFNPTDINRLQPDGGSWPPPDGTLVIERSSLAFSGATVGEPMMLKLGSAAAQPVTLAGVVRDVSLAPGWMEHVVYAFATPATLRQLGAAAGFDEVQIRVHDTTADRAAVRRIAAEARALIEQRGGRVRSVDVPEPGEHMHAAQMDSMLMTQAAFGLLALGVCALLVVNLFTAMLAGQAREIGVLKVLGGGNGHIAALYLGQAGVLGLTACLLALPMALWLGRLYAGFRAELLNFPVAGYAIPAWVIVLQLVVGCLLPVVAAAGPVRRACRIGVGDALRDIGIVADGQPLAARGWLRGWSRPMLLAIGNAFRRRNRMLLTLLALAAGSAVHLGAANLRQAVIGSVDLLFSAQRHDVSLRLVAPQPAAALEARAAAVEGVARAEGWQLQRAVMRGADGEPGHALTVIGLPPASVLMQPTLTAGRWLRAEDSDALVISRVLQRQQPALLPDTVLTLEMGGQARRWRIVGVIDAGPQPVAYIGRDAARASATPATTTLMVALSQRGEALQLDTVQRLRAELAEAGMPVAGSLAQRENRRVVEDHLLMVVSFLGGMGWVMIVIGGMGLASTMGLGVLERTREIGVLRALGARQRSVLAIVQAEGLTLVLLAWLASLPLSVPMSLLLAEAFGRVMFPVPAPWWPAADAALRWLAVMVGVSVLACAWPAWRAVRVPPARALSYQ